MIHWLAILLALCGFALLAISMPRHQTDMAGRKLAPAASRRTRIGGYALLLAVFLLDGFAFGAGYGAVAWFGHLTMGAWSVVAWLCVRARGANSALTKNRQLPPEQKIDAPCLAVHPCRDRPDRPGRRP